MPQITGASELSKNKRTSTRLLPNHTTLTRQRKLPELESRPFPVHTLFTTHHHSHQLRRPETQPSPPPPAPLTQPTTTNSKTNIMLQHSTAREQPKGSSKLGNVEHSFLFRPTRLLIDCCPTLTTLTSIHCTTQQNQLWETPLLTKPQVLKRPSDQKPGRDDLHYS